MRHITLKKIIELEFYGNERQLHNAITYIENIGGEVLSFNHMSLKVKVDECKLPMIINFLKKVRHYHETDLRHDRMKKNAVFVLFMVVLIILSFLI